MFAKVLISSGRRGFGALTTGMAALAMTLGAGTAQAVVKTSVSSGAWANASTWSPPGMPAPGDIVTIAAGHSVHLNSFGSATVPPAPATINLNRLIISNNARLNSDSSAGYGGNVTIQATRVDVQAGGRLVAQDSTAGIAPGSVSINAQTVVNNGEIVAGDGDDGGNVTITCAGVAPAYTGSGKVLGGDGTDPFLGGIPGNVTVSASNTVFLNSGAIEPLIRAGDTFNPFVQGGHVSITGTTSVVINGINAATGPNLKGGDNVSGVTPSMPGGNVDVYTNLCTGDIVVNPGARIEGGTPNAASLSPFYSIIHTYSCGRIRLFGTGAAGCIYWDPPELEMSGDALLQGEIVTVAGAALDMHDLNPGAGLQANDRLELFVSPGGPLNLSTLAPNTAWLRAQNRIDISADAATTVLPPGQSLANLANRPPVVTPGSFFYDVCLTPNNTLMTLSAGQLQAIPLSTMNCGTGDDTFTVSVSDTRGWVTDAFSQNVILTPGSTFNRPINVQVPASATPSMESIATFTAQSNSIPSLRKVVTITLRTPPPACRADVDDGSGTGTPDGGVTVDDFLYYLAIFELGSIRADIDDGSGTGVRDGGVTIDDLLYFLVRFESGC